MWSKFISLFKKQDAKSKLTSLCSSDYQPLNLRLLREVFTETAAKENIQKVLDSLLESLESKPQNKHTKLKFVTLLLYVLVERHRVLAEVTNWVATRRGPKRQQSHNNLALSQLHKSTIMESGYLLNCLASELADKLYFYLIKAVKGGIHLTCVDETSNNLNGNKYTQEISRAYQMANALICLAETHDTFQKIFSRYSGLGLMQQCFDQTRKELNYLYEQFKISFECCCRIVPKHILQDGAKELFELSQVNKKAYKQLRQMHSLAGLLVGEDLTVSRMSMPKLAQLPPQVSKQTVHTRRQQNLKNSSLMTNKSQVFNKNGSFGQHHSIRHDAQDSKHQNMGILNTLKEYKSQDESEEQEEEGGCSEYDG